MKDINGEQPLPNEHDTEIEFENENTNEIEKESDNDTTADGSPIGKFKSVEALYNAYNNLQAEFTKKCQKLSELQKIKDAEACALEVAPQAEEESVETPREDTLDYLSDDWERSVSAFLEANPDAKSRAEAICNEKINEPTLTLEQAYDRVLAREYREPNKLAEDDAFLNEFIYNSEKIKQKVLQDYFTSLEVSPAPHLMGKGYNAVTANQPRVAGSLDEAGKMAVSLFK